MKYISNKKYSLLTFILKHSFVFVIAFSLALSFNTTQNVLATTILGNFSSSAFGSVSVENKSTTTQVSGANGPKSIRATINFLPDRLHISDNIPTVTAGLYWAGGTTVPWFEQILPVVGGVVTTSSLNMLHVPDEPAGTYYDEFFPDTTPGNLVHVVIYGTVNGSQKIYYTSDNFKLFEYDATSMEPILTEFVPVGGSFGTTTDTTPSYIFKSTKAGTITSFGGACASAGATPTAVVAGNNTITFGTLAVGNYTNCTLTVTDANNLKSLDLKMKNFSITSGSNSNSDKSITAYSFNTSPVSMGTIDEALGIITVSVPAGTNKSALKASFTNSSGSTVKVGTTAQVSGTTTNNFTNPVVYTVTPSDNSTPKTYTVTVNAFTSGVTLSSANITPTSVLLKATGLTSGQAYTFKIIGVPGATSGSFASSPVTATSAGTAEASFTNVLTPNGNYYGNIYKGTQTTPEVTQISFTTTMTGTPVITASNITSKSVTLTATGTNLIQGQSYTFKVTGSSGNQELDGVATSTNSVQVTFSNLSPSINYSVNIFKKNSSTAEALPLSFSTTADSSNNQSNTTSNGPGIRNPLGSNYPDIPSFIEAVLNIVLMIGVPIIVLAIIYCGFLFVTALGKPEEIAKAKKAFIYTLVGAALLLGCFIIANAIKGTVDEIRSNT